MKFSQQPTADGRQPIPWRETLPATPDPGRDSGRNAVSRELSGVSGAGRVAREKTRRRWRSVIPAAATLFAAVAGRGVGEAQYLAVFVDGRILPVASANLVGDMRIRLGLAGGGALEIPLSRLDRVIEDAVQSEPEPFPAPSCRPVFEERELPDGTRFAKEIVDASRAANLHPRLVAAVVEAESAFNPFAVSKVGAGGLMQLMPSVWLPYRVTNPYDPRTNLRLGCQHLRGLLDRFGDLSLALAAYNAGVAPVVKSAGVPPYRETREFVRRVLDRFCPGPAPNNGRSGDEL
jgi:hypothetical protein